MAEVLYSSALRYGVSTGLKFMKNQHFSTARLEKKHLACFQAATGDTNTHEKQHSLRALVQQRGWRQFLSPCVRGHLSHTAPGMDYLMKC